jgi:hypothetical protein
MKRQHKIFGEMKREDTTDHFIQLHFTGFNSDQPAGDDRGVCSMARTTSGSRRT